MRFHPPVTVLPTWIRGEGSGAEAWRHELICLDRALADPSVFSDPDTFNIHRENNEAASMAWADFALVDGDLGNPHSHACPGKELSINMVVAFVQEFFEAGFSPPEKEVVLNYYGTKGFKVSKPAY